MLNMIKGIINQKKDFLEAAELILENEMNNLDDSIILGEDTDLPEEPMLEEDDNEEDDKDNDVEDDKKDDESEEDDKGDIIDQPINDEPSNEDDDIMNAPVDEEPVISTDTTGEPTSADPIENPNELPAEQPAEVPTEEPMPIPGNDELPEPVSNVTGEPVADDNILSMEIDLASNTPKDILPIPPASAGDAVVSDDIMDQRIDSGFGESIDSNRDETWDFMLGQEEIRKAEDKKASIEKKKAENDAKRSQVVKRMEEEQAKMKGESTDILNEAITIADAPAAEEAPTEETPAETTTEETPADTPTEEQAPDNEVTAAVKDKVAEAEAPSEAEGSTVSKEELMKKLSALTTGLEKAKELVMKSI